MKGYAILPLCVGEENRFARAVFLFALYVSSHVMCGVCGACRVLDDNVYEMRLHADLKPGYLSQEIAVSGSSGFSALSVQIFPSLCRTADPHVHLFIRLSLSLYTGNVPA